MHCNHILPERSLRMMDFIDLISSEIKNSSDVTVTVDELMEFWDKNMPIMPNTFIEEEAKNFFSNAFLYYTGNIEDNEQLGFISGGWKITIGNNVLKTGLLAASLTGILYLSGFTMLSGYILPAVLPFLFDIEKIKLSKGEEYILAELKLKEELIEAELTPNQIFEQLDETIKREISLIDFIDFMDKLNLSGHASLKGNVYKINEAAKFKIVLS